MMGTILIRILLLYIVKGAEFTEKILAYSALTNLFNSFKIKTTR